MDATEGDVAASAIERGAMPASTLEHVSRTSSRFCRVTANHLVRCRINFDPAQMCAQTSSSLTIVGQERLAQELELPLRVRSVVAADTLSTQTDWLGADESITSAA